MLMCPSCLHEMPLPSAVAATLSSSGVTASIVHGSALPRSSASDVRTSVCPNSSSKSSSCPCDKPLLSSFLSPPCGITQTGHTSKTCHVTPMCRSRAPCHVTPYVCGCALSRSQSACQGPQTTLSPAVTSSASRSCRVLNCPASIDANINVDHNTTCVHADLRLNISTPSNISNQNLNANFTRSLRGGCEAPVTVPCLSGNCLKSPSEKENIDITKAKLASLCSCPTSPSTPLNKSNTWPSNNISHLKTKELSEESATTVKHCCGCICPCYGMCLLHASVPNSNHVCQNHPETLHNCSFNHTTCSDSNNCDGRVPLTRQISCPNTNPLTSRISCPCQLQLQQSFQATQTPVDAPANDLTFNFSQRRGSSHLFSPELNCSSSVNNSSLSVTSRSQAGNFVVFNSMCGGGLVTENPPQPSRSSSPELKFTFSVPLTGCFQSQSGSTSPSQSNSNQTISFDRNALMQTLASLSTIPVTSNAAFSVPNASSCGSEPNSAQSSQGESLSFQNISSRSFPTSTSYPCSLSSSSSSTSPSPVSFDTNASSFCSGCNSHVPEKHSSHCNHLHQHGNDFNRNCSDELCKVSETTNHFITSINNIVMTSPVVPATPSASALPERRLNRPWTSTDDSIVLQRARAELEECGWYYGGLTWKEAGSVLAGSSEGSFLVRDSWSGRCLYALSLQTARGPTSVRIEYESGKFRLESETSARDGVPQRSSVVALVQAYTQTSHPAHVWVDHSGQTVSAISVKKPLRKNPPSLQHLSRLAYNASPVKVSLLDSRIPTLLKTYLESYPHAC